MQLQHFLMNLEGSQNGAARTIENLHLHTYETNIRVYLNLVRELRHESSAPNSIDWPVPSPTCTLSEFLPPKARVCTKYFASILHYRREELLRSIWSILAPRRHHK